MNIHVVGGGPAGLYFAILMKNAWPGVNVTIFERNRADDTFGFGVVFSDQTLATFEKYDAETYRAIVENFSYWDDIEINFKGRVRRVGGNGFCGCARTTLLRLLQERAKKLGVEMKFQTEVDPTLAAHKDADLIVAADGIGSAIRTAHQDKFGTQIDYRPNKFAWMGSTRTFDAFTFFFRETEYGVFIAHCYQYEPNRSTWVMEVQADTFERAGLDKLSEQESAEFLEKVFAEELKGHRLMINRSLWRNFPRVSNERWVMDNVVLIGDAKATAHFSIGSGTKLAMEDAGALFDSFKAVGGTDVKKALHHFEVTRREEVEKTQHSADVSLVWFEHIDRFWNMEPTRFTFGLMTRSKAITYDNLRLRAPEMVAEIDRVPNDFHLVHYGSRAIGGAGLLFTEMTDVSADARISPGCTGIYSDEHEAAWKRIADFVHANSSTKFCIQLGHAGRKGSTKLAWDGSDQPLESGNWEIVAPSALPYYPQSQIPRELTRADMDKIVADYVAAAKRADRAGFDMVELHAAHGYLLASFISPLTNKRTDGYGGMLENRMRFPLEVFRAIRKVWPDNKPMSVRISATDWVDGGVTPDEAVLISRLFAEAGCDLIDVSTGQTVPEARPIYGRMYQTPFSDQIRNEGGLATMCVGAITTADQVNTIVAAGRADLVALARPHLVDPAFTMKAAAWYGAKNIACPPQYQAGLDQLFRNSDRERQDLMELRLKARPKGHATTLEQAAE